MNQQATFGGALKSVFGLIVTSAGAAESAVKMVDNVAKAGEKTSEAFLEEVTFNVTAKKAVNKAKLNMLEEQIKNGTLPGLQTLPQLEA